MKRMKLVRSAAGLSAALVLLVTSIVGCSNKPAVNEPTTAAETATEAPSAEGGTFEGTAQGFGGDVTAKVTVSGKEITALEFVAEGETPAIGGAALEAIQKEVLKKQTTEVDVIAGATVTSKAAVEAINAALVLAGIDPSSLVAVEGTDSLEEIKTEADIVVIGGGGAGMTAAITAKQAGLDVVILEKTGMIGGNTTKATGGMNAAETHFQKEQGIEDTVALFIEDTMTGGKNINNIELVTTMAENSADAIEWLESIGAPLPKVSFSGGASVARIHAPEDGSGVGNYLVAVFDETLKELEIPVYLNTKATEIIMKDGAATGVKVTRADGEHTINAKAVILATGGFGANEEMYTKYREELKGFVTTNTPGATGDGIVMAEAIGANLVDIEQIQIHPTVEQTTSIMVTEGVRGDGAILVNQGGKRFVNEMETRDVVSANVIAQEGGYAYIIFDHQLRENLKATESYVKAGIVEEGETIEALAEKINIDPSVLSETLGIWNEAVTAKTDGEFDRKTGMEHDLTTGPYYAIKIAPGVHHTMGGVEINTSGEVISAEGNVIQGLFAAGEVTGGIHGANRIGGNAVADIVVFGHIAGKSAADSVK